MAAYNKEAAVERSKARTKELTDKLQEGMKNLYTSDKYMRYLKTMSRFPRYSARNIMLIHQQKPDATRVASYGMWKNKFKRNVKKGEQGLYIYAPIGEKKTETKLMEKLDPVTGVPLLDENGKVIMEEMTTLTPATRFMLVPVFDLSQTEGQPLPQLVEDLTGDVRHYDAFVEAMRRVSPLPIEFKPLPDDTDGKCVYGSHIEIREGMIEIQTVSALIHELAHSELHDKNTVSYDSTANPKGKPTKEVESESISYVVCQRYGIETAGNSFGYIASWSGGRELPELKASLETIRKESGSLIERIDARFRQVCKERGIDIAAEVPELSDDTDIVTDAMVDTAPQSQTTLNDDMPIIETINDPVYHFTVDYLDYISPQDGEKTLSDEEIASYASAMAQTITKDTAPSIREILQDKISQHDSRNEGLALIARLDGLFPPQPSLEFMPDPAIGFIERDLYGYTAPDMLPLTKSRADELFGKDNTVYLLYPDNTEAMVFAPEEIDAHDGVFGIEHSDWIGTQEYKELLAVDRAERVEAVKDSGFIFGDSDAFAIYQLYDSPETRDLRFISMAELKKYGYEVKRDNYLLVYTAPLIQEASLEKIFYQFNNSQPDDFYGHSLSVSDIIVMKKGGDLSSHYVDSFGFKELPAFLGNEKSLAIHSAAELEAQVKSGQSISLLDLARAAHNEQKQHPNGQKPSILNRISNIKKEAVSNSEHPKPAPKRDTNLDV